MLHSDYTRLCGVALPFANRQRYMHAIDLADPVMEKEFDDYTKPVADLCRAAGAVSGTAYVTIDEKLVQAGMSQRRPRPHVDGCFVPSEMRWSHGPGGWIHARAGADADIGRMPVIVAASVEGCRAWRGTFDAVPSDAGDLSHIADMLPEGEVLPANVGYLLSPDCVHESMTFDRETPRSFLRIALPVGFRRAFA